MTPAGSPASLRTRRMDDASQSASPFRLVASVRQLTVCFAAKRAAPRLLPRCIGTGDARCENATRLVPDLIGSEAQICRAPLEAPAIVPSMAYRTTLAVSAI